MDDPLTISRIQELTGLPDPVIRYAVRRYGPKPTHRIGMVRVWSWSDWPAIQQSIAHTQSSPQGRPRRGAKAAAGVDRETANA